MNRKTINERARILHCLVEGSSIRSTSRLMDCSKNTVLKLLVDVGEACQRYQDERLVGLPCKRIQVDELWEFVGKKAYNAQGKRNHIMDCWTYTALCPDTKLMVCWFAGDRNTENTGEFILDIRNRVNGKIQLTTDGYLPYLVAVENAFGADVDYAMLKKHVDGDGKVSVSKNYVTGNPVDKHISTAHVERQNLYMRTNIKRFARQTNGFSKNIENHRHAIALHFMHYNFVRIHRSLKVTPAMAAGISTTLWDLEDIVRLSDIDPLPKSSLHGVTKVPL